jgi:chromosomal replication initiator protein DnaA
MITGLNPRYTFETFVAGESNRGAVAAAMAAAEYPGVTRNPLFIQAPPGFGKTHLATAIGHRTLETDVDREVHYFTLDSLIEAYEQATGDIESFHNQLRSATTILIDDAESLERRRESFPDILKFLADLRDAEVQLVLTSDQESRELGTGAGWLAELEDDRVVRIQAPDAETRLAILAQRATERETELSVEVLTLLAERPMDNVRALLGALNRIIAVQAVQGSVLTAEHVAAMLDGGTVSPDALPPARESASPPEADEFGSFLTGVSSVVTEQVQVWKEHVGSVVRQWSERGYNTARLERIVTSGVAVETADAVREYEVAVGRLRELQNQMADCDPALAGDPVFRDPERITEAEQLVREAQDEFEPPPGPSDAFSLEGFLQGQSTRMAINAARSVLAAPGARYNPLVIIGPSGVGKTHLLHAIGRGLQETGGDLVACVSAQSYMDELIRAVEENRVPSWRARYRRATAFLLDNVDMVGGDDRTQEELIFLCNVLLDQERQLIFTSSHRPREIDGMDDRLVSRLEGGLLATIEAPELELRRTVLNRQFAQRAPVVDADVVAFLADQGAESVRSVLALGHRVLTVAEAQGSEPDLETARAVVGATTLRESRVMTRGRPSGVVTSATSGIENREKVVWSWPVPTQCVIEEMA